MKKFTIEYKQIIPDSGLDELFPPVWFEEVRRAMAARAMAKIERITFDGRRARPWPEPKPTPWWQAGKIEISS